GRIVIFRTMGNVKIMIAFAAGAIRDKVHRASVGSDRRSEILLLAVDRADIFHDKLGKTIGRSIRRWRQRDFDLHRSQCPTGRSNEKHSTGSTNDHGAFWGKKSHSTVIILKMNDDE